MILMIRASGLGKKQFYTFCLAVALAGERFCHKVWCSGGSVDAPQVFWNAVLCQLANFYWYFRGVLCLDLQGLAVQDEWFFIMGL